MKILQVMAGAEHGGAETAFVDMCLALHESGVPMEICTRPNRLRVARLEQAGLKVHLLPFGGPADIYTRWKLRRIAKAFQPAIIQTWMSRAAQKVTRWNPRMGIPRYAVVSRLGGYYGRKHFRDTDYFTTITPDIRRHLIEAGVEPGRVRHINNFAETEDDAAPVARAELGVPDNAMLFLALGRLHEAKAFDVLIKAMADVPDAYLWIAGEGPQRAELEALIARLELARRVRLLGWREDRGALLAACDACVFPSRYEPFGTVFVQAWAAKKPLISSNAAGPAQFVRDGIDGLVVPINNATALADAMRQLAWDRALGERLAANGFEHYLETFTRQKAVENYLGFYREIGAQAAGTAACAG